jgi:hypothetical protein
MEIVAARHQSLPCGAWQQIVLEILGSTNTSKAASRQLQAASPQLANSRKLKAGSGSLAALFFVSGVIRDILHAVS